MKADILTTNNTEPDKIGFAILMLMLGIITVTAGDLISKSIIPLVSVWQLLFLRSFFGLLILLIVLFKLNKLPTIKAINLKSVLFRSSLMSACYVCFYLALAKIPIALVAGAFFCGPFFMVLLSRIMLGETFGAWRTGSLIFGFIGVLLILQPTSVEFDPTMILALLSALLYAFTQVITRKYCKKEKPIALSYWLTVTFLITGLFGIATLWLFPSMVGANFVDRANVVPDLFPLLVIAFLGLSSIVIHYGLSAAYQNAPSSLLGPLEYIYLPLAVTGGYFFYDEVPNITGFLGISIIIAAGIVVAWRKED